MKLNLPVANPTQEVTHVQVEVFYSKGGVNYFNYKNEPRGIYALARPVFIEEQTPTGFGVVRFMMFSGKKTLLLEMKRASEKTFRQTVAQVEKEMKEKTGKVYEMLESVLAEANVTLAA